MEIRNRARAKLKVYPEIGLQNVWTFISADLKSCERFLTVGSQPGSGHREKLLTAGEFNSCQCRVQFGPLPMDTKNTSVPSERLFNVLSRIDSNV